MTTQQIIASLDEMRGRVKENKHSENWDTDETFGGDAVIVKRHEFETGMKGVEVLFEGDWGEREDAEYIVALHNNYPTLRNAALEAERYKRAGEALAEVVENYNVVVEEGNPLIEDLGTMSVLAGARECSATWKRKMEEALATYRQAVEQKKV